MATTKIGYTEKTAGEKSSTRLLSFMFGAISVLTGIGSWAFCLQHHPGSEKILLEIPAMFGGICMFIQVGGKWSERVQNMGKFIKAIRSVK